MGTKFSGSKAPPGIPLQKKVLQKISLDFWSQKLVLRPALGTYSKFARKINFLYPRARCPSHCAALLRIGRIFLSYRSQGWVMLAKRIGQVDRRRFAVDLPNLVTCGNRNETLKSPGRFHRDTERYFRKTGTLFKKNRFRRIWSIIRPLYK